MAQNEVRIVFSSVITLILEISPYWLSGLVIGSLISVYLSNSIASKMTALNSGKVNILAILGASCLGVVSPLCMYGTIPVIAAFGRKGIPSHILVTFMVSSVLLNPNLYILGFVLGTGIAMARLFLALLCGILAGVLARMFMRNKPIFRYDRFASVNKGKKTFIRDLLKAFRITGPYLLIGVVLTALVNRYVPPQLIASAFGGREAIGVLFATSLSIPLYACGGGVMPLIRAWLAAGMGTGDALAFMISGPATKITNLAAVKMILGTKNYFVYLIYIVVFAFIVGLVIELNM